MSPAVGAALRAHINACGIDGPPPGPGLWVVEDDDPSMDAVTMLDVWPDGIGVAMDGAVWHPRAVAQVLRHAPVPLEANQ